MKKNGSNEIVLKSHLHELIQCYMDVEHVAHGKNMQGAFNQEFGVFKHMLN